MSRGRIAGAPGRIRRSHDSARIYAYRRRAELTQSQLTGHTDICQRHLSEMGNNKRALGKADVKKLAAMILDCDYRKLL